MRGCGQRRTPYGGRSLATESSRARRRMLTVLWPLQEGSKSVIRQRAEFLVSSGPTKGVDRVQVASPCLVSATSLSPVSPRTVSERQRGQSIANNISHKSHHHFRVEDMIINTRWGFSRRLVLCHPAKVPTPCRTWMRKQVHIPSRSQPLLGFPFSH